MALPFRATEHFWLLSGAPNFLGKIDMNGCTGVTMDPGFFVVHNKYGSFVTMAAAAAAREAGWMRPLQQPLYDTDIDDIPPGPPESRRVFFQVGTLNREDWIEPAPLVVPPEFEGTLE